MMRFFRFLMIFLSFFAVIAVSGCVLGDDDYAVAREEYVVGWLLHNVNGSTDNVLSFGIDDVAVYNYSFNYPASKPMYFDDYVCWVEPVHVNVTSFPESVGNYIAVPLNRTYYVYGYASESPYYYNNWSFAHFMNIFYPGGYDSYGTEEYRSEDVFFALNPRPGDKASVSFGKAPYRPSNVVVEGGRISISDRLVKGNLGNAYLRRDPYPMRYPYAPVYRIIENGVSVADSTVLYGGYWNSTVVDYEISEDSYYVVDVSIPTEYPVWSFVNISAYIANTSYDDIQPPMVLKVDASPSFSQDELYWVYVNASDDSEMSDVRAYFREGEATGWLESEVGNVSGIYNVSVNVSGFNSVDFLFMAHDAYGNSLNYTVENITLLMRDVDVVFDSPGDYVINGSVTYVSGHMEDDAGNLMSDVMADFYLDGNYSDSVITEYTGRFEFRWDSSYDTYRDVNLSVAFEGTGIYGASSETKVVGVTDHYCGDGACSHEETYDSCCMDCGCSSGYMCQSNDCVLNVTIVSPENGSMLPDSTTNVTINLSTVDDAVCRYETNLSNFNFSSSQNLTNTGGVEHTMDVNVSQGYAYTYYYTCNDSEGNINVEPVIHTFSVQNEQLPPEIVIRSPQNGATLSSSVTSVLINITTDENATCRYNTTIPNFTYDDSTNLKSAGTVHTMTISVSQGRTYTYYYKCKDVVGNVNNNQTEHVFSVASESSSTSSGGGSSHSSGGVTATYVSLGHECEDNSDCETDEKCEDYECVKVLCGLCRYPVDHSCRKYMCCKDEDCGDGMACRNNTCLVVKKNDSVMIDEVRVFVESVRVKVMAQQSLRNISVSMDLVDDALMLLEMGKYEEAKSVADAALAALDEAEPISMNDDVIAEPDDGPNLLYYGILFILLEYVLIMLYARRDKLQMLFGKMTNAGGEASGSGARTREIDGLLADVRILVLKAGMDGNVGDDIDKRIREIEMQRDRIAELERNKDPRLKAELDRVVDMIEKLQGDILGS